MGGSRSVPIRLPNDTVIHVEVTSLEQSDDADVTFGDIKDALHIDSVKGAIEGIGQMVTGAVKSLAPDKASAECAIEVGLESGQLTALWVKGTGNANLKITLEWGHASQTS